MEEQYILGFSLIPNIGASKLRRIANHFTSFEAAWRSSRVEDFINAGFKEKTAYAIIKNREAIDISKEHNRLIEQDITLLVCNDRRFPQPLKEIGSAPFLLFCRGDISLLNRTQIAIVGTRRPTEYGTQVTERLVNQLCQTGLVITSGLAQGIDAIAHQTALKLHCPTIAVMGSGVDNAMLAASVNAPLAKEIIQKGGLVISEFPPGFPASRFTFPARNRIISGLSRGVLVVEAGEKSGSLITASNALDQNREIFAVPGNIFSVQSTGTNQLLKQGAKTVTCVQDILEALNFSFPFLAQPERKVELQDVEEEKIYKILSYEPMHVDQLLKKTRLDPSLMNAKLSLLELRGIIKNTGGGKFIRI